jgi:hypothetical protein
LYAGPRERRTPSVTNTAENHQQSDLRNDAVTLASRLRANAIL